MALEPPGQFQFEQDCRHQGRHEAGLTNEFVDRDRGRPEQARESAALGAAGLGLGDGHIRTGPVRLWPRPGDCCTAHGTAGCNDATCESNVCLIDAACCGTGSSDELLTIETR